MRPFASLALLSACGVDPTRVPAFPPYAPDAAHLDAGSEITVAVARADCDDAALTAIVEVAPDLVVFTGEVERSTTELWEQIYDRWAPVRHGGARFLAVPGEGDRKGDPQLVGFGAAFQVPKAHSDSWGSVDLDVAHRRWRFVRVDPNAKKLGDAFTDQLYWLPSVVGTDDFDLLVVIEGHGPDEARLREVIDAHRGGLRLVLRIDADAEGITLENGQWGAATLGGATGYSVVRLDKDRLTIRGTAAEADWQRGGGWTTGSR